MLGLLMLQRELQETPIVLVLLFLIPYLTQLPTQERLPIPSYQRQILVAVLRSPQRLVLTRLLK